MSASPTAPELWIVVGANGAGKTTWARNSRRLLPKPFYNADTIALGDPNSAETLRRKPGAIGCRVAHGFERTPAIAHPDIARDGRWAPRIGTEHHGRFHTERVGNGHDIPVDRNRRW